MRNLIGLLLRPIQAKRHAPILRTLDYRGRVYYPDGMVAYCNQVSGRIRPGAIRGR